MLARCFVLVLVVTVSLVPQGVPWPPGADKGNRYEAFVDAFKSSTDFQLLSFLASPIVSGDTPEILRIAFYSPTKATAIVSGRELGDLRQYRLESKPIAAVQGWGNEFSWPSRDVVGPARLGPTDLGFTVTLSQAGRATRFAPAVFVQSPGAPKPGIYTAIVKPRYTLKSLTYSIVQRTAGIESTVRTADAPGTFSAGDPSEVRIDVSGLGEGEALLRFTGTYAYQPGGPIAEYPFYLKSSR
jgi:hypothetical protein